VGGSSLACPGGFRLDGALTEGAARPQRSKMACLPAFVLVRDLNLRSLRSRERRFESCWGSPEHGNGFPSSPAVISLTMLVMPSRVSARMVTRMVTSCLGLW
jgi:hypothetical protein